jgi:transcription elongation GreA/GreB family factor
VISKDAVIAAVLSQLAIEREALLGSARAAQEAATHEESKAEDSHDTRGLEASYLAGAQALRLAELDQLITAIRLLPPTVLKLASIGALVELELVAGTKTSLYFLVPTGGGVRVRVDGRDVQVITPRSPLGDALVGRSAGDTVEIEVGDEVREYRVAKVT